MIRNTNYGGGDDAGFGQPVLPAMPSAETYGGPSIADQMAAQYPLRHGPSPYVGISQYGDQQALMTQNRAGYGAYPAAMMSGMSSLYGGVQLGMNNMLSDMGRMFRPISYTPPAYMMTGYAGQFMQQTSFLGDLAILSNMRGVPPGVRPSEYRYNAAADLGERVGLSATGVAAGLGTFALSGLAGSAAANFFGRGLGGRYSGLIKGAGFLVGSMLGYSAADGAASRMFGSEQEFGLSFNGIENYLESTSSRYITTSSRSDTDPRTGGFSARSRRQVRDYLRDIEFKDPTMNLGDIAGILKGSTEMGLFYGTNDVEDFKKKFKSIVDNVKVVSRTLKTTLDEGLKAIKDLKGIGIDAGSAANLVMGSEIAGRVAGRTAGEMFNIGLQGAEMFRGTGIEMRIGFEANQMNLAAIRAARDAKMLSNEAIAQAGGEEALSQRLTASGLSHTQTSVGRGFGAYYYSGSKGGSGFNKGAFMSTVFGGGVNPIEAAMQGAKNLSSPADMLRYEANQELVNSEIGKMFGGQGLQIRQMTEIMSQAQMLSQTTGVDMETAYRKVGSTQGLSKDVMDTQIAMMKNAMGNFQSGQLAAQRTRDQAIIDQSGDNFYLSGLGRVIEKKVSRGLDAAGRPVRDAISNFMQGLQDFAEYQGQGISRYDVGKTGFRGYISDARLDKEAELAAKGLRLTADGKQVPITANLYAGGTFAFKTIGGELEKVAEAAAEGNSIYNLKLVSAKVGKPGPAIITNKSMGFGMDRGIASFGEIEEAARIARTATIPLSVASAAFESGAIKEESELVKSAILAGKLSSVKTGEDAAQKVFGRGIGKLSREEFQALRYMTRNIEPISESFGAYEEQGRSVLAAQDRILVDTVNDAKKRAGDAKSKLEGALNVKNLPAEAVVLLDQIRESGRDPNSVSNLKAQLGEVLMSSPDTARYAASRLDDLVNRAASGDQKIGDLLAAFGLASREIARGVEARGVTIMREGFVASVNAAKDISKEDRQKLLDIGDMVGNPQSMQLLATSEQFQDQRNLLSKTGVAPLLDTALTSINRVSTHQMTSQELSTALEKSGVIGEQRTALIQQYQNNNISGVVSALAKSAAADVGGTTGAAAPQGPATSSATGTAQEAYSVQTQINRETLAIMTALADKLTRK